MVRKFLLLIATANIAILFLPTVESDYAQPLVSPSSTDFPDELTFHVTDKKDSRKGWGACFLQWTRPDPIRYCSYYNFQVSSCYHQDQEPKRMDNFDSRSRPGGEGMMITRKTNKIEPNTLAQEGLSYCIFPKHILESESSLKNWKLINKTMKELMDVNFDIGTHINPKDYSKMNAVSTKPKVEPPYKPQTMCSSTDDSYINRAAEIEAQPDISCKNPYKIQVSEIKANGRRLQNWLHIKVYAEKIAKTNITLKCPTGAMRYVLLEVRDQGGLPVGEFTDEIPCDHPDSKETLECPEGVACRKIVGTRKNTMPCMMDPYRAITHPWIFMAGTGGSPPVGGGNATNSTGSSPGTTTTSAPAATTEEPFTEIHISWKFAQHTSSIVTQLHFSALIVENTTKVNYFSGRRDKFSPEFRCDFYHTHYDCWRDENLECSSTNGIKGWRTCNVVFAGNLKKSKCERWHVPVQDEPRTNWYGCNLAGEGKKRMYGFTAQYTPLFPTLRTVGAPDYFNRKFTKASDINCHAPMADKTFFKTGAEWKGAVPPRYNQIKDISRLKPRKDYYPAQNGGPDVQPHPSSIEFEGFYLTGRPGRNPGDPSAFQSISANLQKERNPEFFSKYHDISDAAKNLFDQPATTYFGTQHTKESYGPDYDKKSLEMDKEFKAYKSLQQQAATARCPCPKVPTTVPPEFATRPPNELDGRRYHSIQMLIAWVILIPISIFSSRYYKETFSKVFFLEEFWWYSIHVLSLFTALIFMLGGIYSLEIKKAEGGVWVDATWIHVILGSVTIILFAIHLCVGCFRSFDVNVRILQIMLHWLFGWLEYLMASATILISSRIPQGFVSCEAIYVYYGFLSFQVIFYIGMEIHMRYVDRLLHLNPPRSYLPPPMMRLFHRNAPFSVFRMYMLVVYSSVCICVYAAMHILMAVDVTSCYQEVRKKDVEVNI